MKSFLIISHDSNLIQNIIDFSKNRFRIRVTSDIDEIQKTLKIFNGQAVFLDIDIDVKNSLDGLMLLKEIKSCQPSLPVAAFSSCLAQKVIKCALRLGAVDYLVKPLDRQLFESCLKEILSCSLILVKSS